MDQPNIQVYIIYGSIIIIHSRSHTIHFLLFICCAVSICPNFFSESRSCCFAPISFETSLRGPFSKGKLRKSFLSVVQTWNKNNIFNSHILTLDPCHLPSFVLLMLQMRVVCIVCLVCVCGTIYLSSVYMDWRWKRLFISLCRQSPKIVAIKVQILYMCNWRVFATFSFLCLFLFLRLRVGWNTETQYGRSNPCFLISLCVCVCVGCFESINLWLFLWVWFKILLDAKIVTAKNSKYFQDDFRFLHTPSILIFLSLSTGNTEATCCTIEGFRFLNLTMYSNFWGFFKGTREYVYNNYRYTDVYVNPKKV